jgi:hypothetical protein
MLLAAFAVAGLLAEHATFYAHGPYNAKVPRPEAILGYIPGEKVTTYHDQERVLTAIAAAEPTRVKEVIFGKSTEGRPLRVFVVASPKNLANLEAIRKAHQAIAEGHAELAAQTPSIVWVNECIHGNEPASFEAGMELVYNLAASRAPEIEQALQNTVVIVNPSYNPDGHERFAVYYGSLALGASEPGAYEQQEPRTVYGRVNHYRFDMNRDRISMSQKETRAEVDEFFRWNPQVYLDQHGQVGTYFTPPNPMSVNVNVDRPRFNQWTELFGRAVGAAFDALGFSYYVKNEFDLYYPGYLDSFTSLAGAIGMTHETDGGPWIAKRRPDGSIVTLVHGAEKHFTSALAVIEASHKSHDALMASYADFKKNPKIGEFKRVVVTSPDSRPLDRLRIQLSRAHIESYFSAEAASAEDATDYWTGKTGHANFPAGSLVVDIQQPQAALAKALLEPSANFEPEFVKAQQNKRKTAPEGETYPGPEGAEFYDLTGWALPYAHNLQAYWCKSAPAVRKDRPDLENRFTSGASRSSSIGFAVPYSDREDALAVIEALQAGLRGAVTTKPMSLAGKSYPRGTFLFLAERNPEGYDAKLLSVILRHRGQMIPLTTAYPDSDRESPGSDSTEPLKAPKIGIVFGQGDLLADVGSVWWLFENEFHLPFTALNGLPRNLNAYTCLIVPRFASLPTSDLREWISNGGVLILLGGGEWANSGLNLGLEPIKATPRSLPGSLFRAKLEPRSPLTYGYSTNEIAVPIAESRFYQIRKAGGGAITLDPDPKANKLLSGWEYDDDTEKNLAGTVWLQDSPIGAGHVVTFTQDPTERALWPGLEKLLLNAILLGHGRFSSE